MHADITLILSKASPATQALFYRAQELVEAVMPYTVKLIWPKQYIISYGVGPKKMSEHFCYINVLPSRINLGFYYGSMLSDPKHLLEGTGKLLRHVKIIDLKQLEDQALCHLIQEASTYLPKLQR